MTICKIITVDAEDVSSTAVDKAAAIIQRGGTIVFPTMCLYGLGADALNPAAVKQVFSIKRRSVGNPVSILIRHPSDMGSYVKTLSSAARKIIENFWPGKITLVCKASHLIPEILTAGTGNIGIRAPEHPVITAVLNRLNHPVTGTSANISGQKGCSQIVDLDSHIIDGVDLVLDAGPLKGGMGSTVVDVTIDPPRVLREGAVSSEALFSIV